MGEKVPHAILNSWRRCQATGLDPDKLDFADPVELDLDNELVRMAQPVIEHYRPVLSDTKAVLLLLDEQARLLLRCEGDARLARAYDRAKAIPGVCYSKNCSEPPRAAPRCWPDGRSGSRAASTTPDACTPSPPPASRSWTR